MAAVLVLADDFSGAAEVAQQFAAQDLTARITLRTAATDRCDARDGATEVVVVDTHSRGKPAAAAAAAVRAAVTEANRARAVHVFKKTDSLWRGNVGAELSVLAELGYHVVLAGALPAMERTVVGAKPFAGGLPLHASDLWHVEPLLPPQNLAGLFAADSALRFAGLDDVRSADFAVRLDRFLRGSGPAVVIVDGETDGDLAAVVEAVATLGFASGGRPVALAGTGQLAGLLARRLAQEAAHTAHSRADADLTDAPARRRGPVLAVVGSASPAARRQVEHLAAEGFDTVGIRPHEERPEPGLPAATRIRTALTENRCVALTVADSPLDPARSANVVARLARLAREGQRGIRADLILTGGETAHEVLDALGITSLVPRNAVQHGAVVSMADNGRLVATKPGSFGDPLVLVQLYHSIRSHTSTAHTGLPTH